MLILLVMSPDASTSSNSAAGGATGSTIENREAGQATETAAVIHHPTMTGLMATEEEQTAAMKERTEQVGLAVPVLLPQLCRAMSTALIGCDCILLLLAPIQLLVAIVSCISNCYCWHRCSCFQLSYHTSVTAAVGSHTAALSYPIIHHCWRQRSYF